MADRLEAIKRRWEAETKVGSDMDWLVSELEAARQRIAELERAEGPTYADGWYEALDHANKVWRGKLEDQLHRAAEIAANRCPGTQEGTKPCGACRFCDTASDILAEKDKT
jgi:hypothetical protein